MTTEAARPPNRLPPGTGTCWWRSPGSPGPGSGTSPPRPASPSALIANMTVPELRVPPGLISAHHHIHLDRRAQRQGGHADRGAGRVGLGEVPAVRLVHRAELRLVGQVDPDPDHVV